MKKDWTIKKLGEVCEIKDSQRKPITANKRKPGSIPYYGATGILDYVEDYLFDEDLILLGEDGAKWGSGDRSAFKISGKTWVNNHAHVLKPANYIDYTWLIYYLNYSDLTPFVKGATVPKLNQENTRNIPIPLPPLEEQKRIVAVLDKKFAQIETLKTAAEKNLQNTKQLFQAELEKAFSNDNSKKVSLSDVCDVSSSKRIYAEEQTQSGVPFLRVSDLVARIQGIERNDLFISKELFIEFKNKGLVPKENDVLVTSRGTLGLCYIVKKNDEFYFQDGMITWLSLKQNIDAKFLTYLFESELVKKQIKDKSAGAAVNYISISEIRKFKIILPALEKQKRIVAHLDSLSEKVHQLEEIYTKQLADCDEIEQSLLQRAFEGEL